MDDLDVAGDTRANSGITLVLPSLRALKAANAGKKPKAKPEAEQRPKIPRPIKLKPLKEVLTKLITQIKKKDDYAFFIRPVDPAQVPGYADAIQHPMDFGTMAAKVTKGRYRSLEDFASDFRLVTTNAKTFNPPGSIYHSEADRLELWGLDHIARASAHVIEYETDWNIDVEQDEDGSVSLPVNVDEEVSTPRDVEESIATGSRAPSVTPAPGLAQGTTSGQGRRGPRGPYKKHAPTGLSEGLDAEGRMPGAKDGVGAFPAGSDWAELMIALKIKGKRYKTKKERLRFEKEGPPYQTDGSLDYAEMEDPFSFLNVLVPEPPTLPQVAPLYPPPSTTAIPPIPTVDGLTAPFRIVELRTHAPIAVTIPPNRPTPVLSTLSNVPPLPAPTASTSTPTPRPPKKRRHWTIVRNVPARSRAKDKPGDGAVDDAKPAWRVPRDAGPADYGTFATLLGELAASVVRPHAGGGMMGMGAAEYVCGTEHRLFATIRSTVAHRGTKRKRLAEEKEEGEEEEEEEEEAFWTDARAEEGWDYVRDVVYGGVDGYAYVRSLAEFVAPSVYLADVRAADGDGSMGRADRVHPLGVPVARYVEDNLVDTVTRGRHGWLRDILCPGSGSGAGTGEGGGTVCSPFHVRLAALPGAAREVALFKEWSGEQLDMASLIQAPEELAKESVLEGGASGEGGEHAAIERALAWSVEVIEALGGRAKAEERVKEEAVEEAHIVRKEEEEESTAEAKPDPDAMDVDTAEAPLVKRLRMNLLALAKRAPLDKIAKLPVALVPEDIRGIVPTA